MGKPVNRLNGYFKWVALVLSIGVPITIALVNVYSDVRVVEESVQGLESKMDMQYENILRELDTIKSMVR